MERPTEEKKETSPQSKGPAYGYLPFILYGALAVVGVVLAFEAHNAPFFPGDLELASTIQSVPLLPFQYIWLAITILGERPLSLAILFLLAGGLWIWRRGREGAFILLTIVPDLANIALKELVGRPRPSPELVKVLLSGSTEFSFPSSHVVHFVVFYGLIYYLAPGLIPSPLFMKTVRFLSAALILLVGPARVYVGAHWPSDVVGGYIIGGLFLWAIIALFKGTSSRQLALKRGPLEPLSGP